MPPSTLIIVLIVAVAVGALVLGWALTPLAGRLGLRTGAIDRPAAHRPRHRPVPRTGGIAVAIAFSAAGAIGIAVAANAGVLPRHTPAVPIIAVLLGGTLMAALLGFLDDRRDMSPLGQFVAQVALGLIPVIAGLRITDVTNPLGDGDIRIDEPFAAAAVVIWIVGLINSFNFVDGLDGLSGGMALIAAVTLGVIAFGPATGQPGVALLCAALVGALLGFLRWNFHPASIFIGTSGVFVVGYALGVLAILGGAKVAVALLVLGVPIIDTFWVIVRRLLAGRSPFAADRQHLHHRLLDLGLTHRGAVILVYVICAFLATMSLVLSGAGPLYAFLGAILAGGLVLHLVGRRAENVLRAENYPDPPGPELLEDVPEGVAPDARGAGPAR